MPIFEYACDSCHQHFELLVRSDTQLACPHCHATALTKQLSVIAKPAGDSAGAAMPMPMGPCGSCGHPDGPGACQVH